MTRNDLSKELIKWQKSISGAPTKIEKAIAMLLATLIIVLAMSSIL